MAFDWDHVEQIRAEQERAKTRYNAEVIPSNETAARINDSAGARMASSPPLDHYEAMIMKMRTQLIDWIVAHGLVDGWILDGVLQPIQNGKIVLTSDAIKQITDKFGYFTEEITKKYLDKYLPENHYVADENYVHTDNNYDNAAVEKLAGIEAGAEVNKIIDVVFNGSTVLDEDTRIATITITPEDIKNWYESNPDVNPFTDADKAKLEGIEDGAQVNAVEDVTVDGVTVLDPADKTAKITKEIIKASYESNADTNAFTDAEKEKLAGIAEGAEVNDVKDVTLDGKSIVSKDKIAELTAAAIKSGYESNANTNAFTDADKELVERTVPALSEQNHDHEKRLGDLELSQHLQDDEIAKLKEKDVALDKEISDTKNSISELGDEVNSIAGRVTTLEASQTAQDGRLDALDTSEEKQDADIEQLKTDIKNAGKVDDVQVNGVSVLDKSTKVANITGVAKTDDIPDVSQFVPYTGASKAVDLGEHDFTARNMSASFAGQSIAIGADGINTTEKNIPFIGPLGDPATLTIGDPTNDEHAATKKYVDAKIAEIPSVDTSNLVPYSGATKDVDIGNHSLIVATTKQQDLTTRTESYSLNANVGMDTLKYPGVSIETKKDEFYPNAEAPYTQIIRMGIIPGNFSVLARTETSQGVRTDKTIELTEEGLRMKSTDNSILITDTSIKELADPADGRDAANKKYVDESIAAIPETDTSNLVPYTGATKDVNIGNHKLLINTTGIISGIPSSAEMHVGKFEHGESNIVPGIKINAKAEGTTDGATINQSTDMAIMPGVVEIAIAGNTGDDNKEINFRMDSTGVTLGETSGKPAVKISPEKITGLSAPVTNDSAANKKYVDSKILEVKIPTIKVSEARLDKSEGNLTLAANDVGTFQTQRYTIPSCLGLTGILSVSVRGTEPIPYQLMGEVIYLEDTVQDSSSNTHTVLFKVFVHNPQPKEVTIDTMVVKFAYLSN